MLFQGNFVCFNGCGVRVQCLPMEIAVPGSISVVGSNFFRFLSSHLFSNSVSATPAFELLFQHSLLLLSLIHLPLEFSCKLYKVNKWFLFCSGRLLTIIPFSVVTSLHLQRRREKSKKLNVAAKSIKRDSNLTFQREASNPSPTSEIVSDPELANRIREADLDFGLVGFDEDKLGLANGHHLLSTSPAPVKAPAEAPSKSKRRSSVMRTMNVRRSSRFFRRNNSDSDKITGSVFQDVNVEVKQKAVDSNSSSADAVGSSKSSLPKVLASVENIDAV